MLEMLRCQSQFLSTPSARRATVIIPPTAEEREIFLSTPSARRATVGSPPYCSVMLFLSTPSARRATLRGRAAGRRLGYFYPRPPRGGRPLSTSSLILSPSISIHALREEGDLSGDPTAGTVEAFLSTPSARRATGQHITVTFDDVKFLSTPSARRATQTITRKNHNTVFLSTPSARRATITDILTDYFELFLSTPSARRATVLGYTMACLVLNFYPRPPRGGRRKNLHKKTSDAIFLSTPSARRATPARLEATLSHLTFLSTPSARRATSYAGFLVLGQIDFYPRPPRGGRRTLREPDGTER